MRGIDAVVDARSVQRRRERGTAGVLPLALLLRTMLANAVKIRAQAGGCSLNRRVLPGDVGGKCKRRTWQWPMTVETIRTVWGGGDNFFEQTQSLDVEQ